MSLQGYSSLGKGIYSKMLLSQALKEIAESANYSESQTILANKMILGA